MQTRQLGFALVGIVILVIGFVVGLRFQTSPPSTRNPKDRLITISAAGTGKCEVDFPVALLHYDHTVQWASNDNQYWISFLTIDAPAGYTPENPLVPVPSNEPAVVASHGLSKKYNVIPKTKYYMYAIFDHDPSTNSKNPCKAATDDRDIGLNIKPQGTG